MRVLVAKLVTYAALAAVLSLLAIGLGLAIAAPVVASKDLTLGYSGMEVLQLFGSVLLARSCSRRSGSRSPSSAAASRPRCWS